MSQIKHIYIDSTGSSRSIVCDSDVRVVNLDKKIRVNAPWTQKGYYEREVKSSSGNKRSKPRRGQKIVNAISKAANSKTAKTLATGVALAGGAYGVVSALQSGVIAVEQARAGKSTGNSNGARAVEQARAGNSNYENEKKVRQSLAGLSNHPDLDVTIKKIDEVLRKSGVDPDEIEESIKTEMARIRLERQWKKQQGESE